MKSIFCAICFICMNKWKIVKTFLCKTISFVRTIIIVFIAFSFADRVYAALYMDLDGDGKEESCYIVDKNHASASNSWSKEENNEEHPWRDAWYGAQQLESGDILLIKSGIYSNETGHRYLPGIRPSHSGTSSNHIVIRNYPGHTVYIVGGYTGSINLDISPTLFENPAIGVFGYDYIDIIGLNVYGCVTLWSTEGSSIQNCNIWGGNDKEFGCCIRMEDAHNCYIANNIVRDNVLAGDGSGNSSGNCPLLMEYDSENTIIEHNRFINSIGYGIYLKDHPVNFVIRYNYFKLCAMAAFCASNQDNPDNLNSVSIFQNIFGNNACGIALKVAMSYVNIYNNTFYNNDTHFAIEYDDFGEINLYNNIFSEGNIYYAVHVGDAMNSIDILDNNCFYSGQRWNINWSTVAHNFLEWKNWLQNQGYGDKEIESMEGNPLLHSPENLDFHLDGNSPCLNAGRGGIPLGCYIVGTETIGPLLNVVCDVNQDGSVNISDVQLVVNVILGSVTNGRADVNGDGSVNVQDVQAVVNEIVD